MSITSDYRFDFLLGNTGILQALGRNYQRTVVRAGYTEGAAVEYQVFSAKRLA